jgi:hypothetical protein
MNRRDLLKLGGMALATGWTESVVMPLKVKAAGKANPRNNARFVIFIELPGAISPMECWDFKETKDTPRDLDIQKVSSELNLSKTLFPNYTEWTSRASLVRSMRAPELVHFTGQYHTQTGRALNVAVAKEIPAFGSVIAAELDKSRRDNDTFPTYMSVAINKGRVGAIGSGLFPAKFTGMDLDPASVFESFGGSDGGHGLLEERWAALRKMSAASPTELKPLGEKASEFGAFYSTAYSILDDSRWNQVFKAVTEEDRKKYVSELGLGCAIARNILAADAGTRFVYICDAPQPWDHHSFIFDRTRPNNHYNTCLNLDRALSNLVKDLASTPSKTPGKMLIDETMVVVTSEFGRMPYMNNVYGRDHYKETYTSLFLGAGVKPGRIIGKTNADCSKCIDTGWKHKEQPTMDNIVATIYSALGIDWLKVVENTPSGRAYHYVQTAPVGGSEFISNDSIDELFA